MSRFRLIPVVLTLVGLSYAPPAVQAAGPVVSNAMVDLSGAVPVGDVGPVTLSGSLHVVTRVQPVEGGHLITVYANLPANVGASGPNDTRFIVIGASRHADVHDISNGDIIPCIMPGFTLMSAPPANGSTDTTGSINPVTFEIRLRLQFSSDGVLTAGGAAPVGDR